jgi:hypothetical protein
VLKPQGCSRPVEVGETYNRDSRQEESSVPGCRVPGGLGVCKERQDRRPPASSSLELVGKGTDGVSNETDIARLAEPCVVPRIGVLKAQSENREPNAVAAQTNVWGKSESEKTR